MVTKPVKTGIPRPPAMAELRDDLTIEYPSEDGERLAETEYQFSALAETVYTCRDRYVDRPDIYVGGNMLVYYRMNDTTVRVAPDVFVVLGVDGAHPRNSWLIWREGAAPDFVMEVASRGTYQRDRAEKRDIYRRMGVTEYWRYDPTKMILRPQLIGERLAGDAYQPIIVAEDADGILRGYSALLGLDICVFDQLEPRLYDPLTQEWLPTRREIVVARRAAEDARLVAEAARQAAEDAREAEAEARQSAEAEVRLLREQLRRLQSQ